MLKPIFKKAGLPLLALGAASVWSTQAKADCSPNPYIGSVCMTVASFCPMEGDLYADLYSQLLPINQFTALFAITGDAYGGDMRTTFGIPDARGRVLVQTGTAPGLSPILRGERDGLERRRMTAFELPEHTHAGKAQGSAKFQVSAQNGTIGTPSKGNYRAVNTLGANQRNAFISAANAGNTVSLGGSYTWGNVPAPSVSGSTGNGNSFENLSPQLGIRYCIAIDGQFPPRT